MRANPKSAIAFLSVLTLLTLILAGYVGYSSRQSRVVIEWSTASELETVGFNVYRSESPDGVGEKINEQLIPAASDPLSGGDYQFVDTTARPGQAYYYWLEDVGASGKVGRNGPIETNSAAGMGIEWLLLAVLAGTLVWGWIGLLRSRPAVSSAEPMEG
jgi:hypothetical protein